MQDVEKFSSERYLSDWSLQRNSVEVEGSLQDDGDSYIVDRDPQNPSTLLRVRKSDILAAEQSKKVRCRNGERQVYRISIKRGVPVQVISTVGSDDLVTSPKPSLISRPSDVVSANFVNSTLDLQYWTVKDLNANVLRLDNQLFEPQQSMSVELETSEAGVFGDAKYWHAGQTEADGTEVAEIEAGQVVEMNG